MPVGDTVHRLGTVTSTNDAARALALEGAAHGTAVLASAQTLGRGTKGRTWHSPAGLGLYASFILRGPGGGAFSFPHFVPLIAGLAAADALREASGIEARLKWPNDILHEDKKLGGVLSEGISRGGGRGFVVVGIGLNVGHEAGDFPDDLRAVATSVRLAGGRPSPDRDLFGALCRALDRWYNVLTRGEREAIVAAFAARTAIPPGAGVIVRTAGGVFEAEYRGLDHEGRLVVSLGGAGTLALDAVLKLDRSA